MKGAHGGKRTVRTNGSGRRLEGKKGRGRQTVLHPNPHGLRHFYRLSLSRSCMQNKNLKNAPRAGKDGADRERMDVF